jgi:DNA-binding transcriptional ArsR family regulator
MPRLSRAGGNPQTTIDSGASYEFVLSLATVFEVENHDVAEVGAQWLAAVRERAGTDLMQRLAAFTNQTGDFFVHLVPLAYDAPPPRTVEGLLDHLAGFDATELILLIVGFHDYHTRRTTPPEVIRAAVDGDRGARERFVGDLGEHPEWQSFVALLLSRDPARVKDELLELLRAWHERVWRDEQDAILPILERDAESKRELARELPFDRFVEVATNGVQFVPHAGIDRLVLIPSWVNRPWVSYAEYGGAMFLCFPVADESLSAAGDAPPMRLLRLTKALGDEKRLRILRALANGPRTLADLTEQFDVPKTTMHHHMITLRSAGLVSVGAGSKEYRLRADVLPTLAQQLGGYLGGPANGRASVLDDRAPTALPSAGPGRRTRTLAPAGRRSAPTDR